MILKNIWSHDWNDPTDENEFQRAEREKRQADWRAHHHESSEAEGPVRSVDAVTPHRGQGRGPGGGEEGRRPGKYASASCPTREAFASEAESA